MALGVRPWPLGKPSVFFSQRDFSSDTLFMIMLAYVSSNTQSTRTKLGCSPIDLALALLVRGDMLLDPDRLWRWVGRSGGGCGYSSRACIRLLRSGSGFNSSDFGSLEIIHLENCIVLASNSWLPDSLSYLEAAL